MGIRIWNLPVYCKAHQEQSISKFKRRRWLDVKVLMIDEISMVDSILLGPSPSTARVGDDYPQVTESDTRPG